MVPDRSDPQQPFVRVVSRDGLYGLFSATAVDPLSQRVYLGTHISRDRFRRNITVLALDDNLVHTVPPRTFRDTDQQITPGAMMSVTDLLVDPVRRKLYIAHQDDSLTNARMLTTYDLDANGDPVGQPRSYDSGNPHHSLLALALHPRGIKLYLVGWGDPAVHAFTLNAGGEPTGTSETFPVGGCGKYAIAVDPNGRHLYLGTYPDTLEVLDLDARGVPTSAPARLFRAPHGPSGQSEYLMFRYSPRALYRRFAPNFLGHSTPSPLVVWPLGSDGLPRGEPVEYPQLSTVDVAPSPDGDRVVLATAAVVPDAFDGVQRPHGLLLEQVTTGPDGLPTGQVRTLKSVNGQEPVLLAPLTRTGPLVVLSQARNASEKVNRVRDIRMRITVLDARSARGPLDTTGPVMITLGHHGSRRPIAATATPGTPLPWTVLDQLAEATVLRGERAQVLTAIAVGSGEVTALRLRIDVAEGDPESGGVLLKSMTEQVEGDTVQILLPGYGMEDRETRVAATELLSEHAMRYVHAAEVAAVPERERPRDFVVSCGHLLGGQGHRGQLEAEARAMSLLGCNTVNAYLWGKVPPAEIDAVLDRYGFTRRGAAVYMPPSHFDFDLTPASLDAWAREFPARIAANNGASPADVVDFKLADEPGWYYPTVIDQLRGNRHALERFRAYLREHGFIPHDLGARSWSQIMPVGQSTVRTGTAGLATRRLFYWTVRFFTESASHGHALAREALVRAFGHPLTTDVNWNNVNAWYVGWPGHYIGNNPIAGPDSGYGTTDWLESGRQSAHTLFTEDWFGDQFAQQWSYYSDALRSAAMLGQREFGGYIIGATLGDFADGASYKVLSLVGHGAKTIDFYSFGPQFFQADMWSEMFRAYAPIARALRRLGRAERLLFPGRPSRGSVAVQIPGGSAPWEHGPCWGAHNIEPNYLHTALTHGGYSVDFVDDRDLAAGALEQRGYRALYLTQPNIAIRAQAAVTRWVRAGGTLAVTPGTATVDEYNTPTTAFDTLLGVRARGPAGRECLPPPSVPPTNPIRTGVLHPSGGEFGSTEIELHGPVSELTATTAGTAATFSEASNNTAIALRSFGNGRVITYGFYPGWEYWLSADRRETHALPSGWGPVERQIAIAPARIAGTPHAIEVSIPGVEALRLESDAGIAVVLLNWTGTSIDALGVTVPNPGRFSRVSSIERGALVATPRANTALSVTLPLATVDVLMLEAERE
jgi:hypothetical protein